jgi:hypothetical protein
MTELDALNAGLTFLNNPTIEGAIKMTEPFSNDWTEKFDELERRCEKSIADKKLYEEALEVACEEYEAFVKNYIGKYCVMREIAPGNSKPDDCDNDCGACLKAYFLKRGQDNIDMEKSCKDEIAGRKRMDEQDSKKSMKEAL